MAGEMSADLAEWLSGHLAPWRAKYPEVQVSQRVIHAASPGMALAKVSVRAGLLVVRHAHSAVAIIPDGQQGDACCDASGAPRAGRCLGRAGRHDRAVPGQRAKMEAFGGFPHQLRKS